MFYDITGLDKINNEINKNNTILNDINNDGNIDIDNISINIINKYLNNSKINIIGNLDMNNNDILRLKELILSSLVSIGGSVNVNEVELSICRDNIIVLNKPPTTQGINVDSGVMISYSGDFNPSLIYKKNPQSENLNGLINRFVLGNINVSGSNIDANGNPYSGNVNITDLSILHVNSLEGNLFGNLDIGNETSDIFIYGNVYIDNLIYIPNYYERTYNYILWNPINNTQLASNIMIKMIVINSHVTLSFPSHTATQTGNVTTYLTSAIGVDNYDIPEIFRPKTMVSKYINYNRAGQQSSSGALITFPFINGNYIALSTFQPYKLFETIAGGSVTYSSTLEWVI